MLFLNFCKLLLGLKPLCWPRLQSMAQTRKEEKEGVGDLTARSVEDETQNAISNGPPRIDSLGPPIEVLPANGRGRRVCKLSLGCPTSFSGFEQPDV